MAHLTVYVAPNCIGCDRALELVETIRQAHGESSVIEIVDTSDPGVTLPEDLFAVPSWYVDGTRVSLGNPTEAEIERHLDEEQEITTRR